MMVTRGISQTERQMWRETAAFAREKGVVWPSEPVQRVLDALDAADRLADAATRLHLLVLHKTTIGFDNREDVQRHADALAAYRALVPPAAPEGEYGI